MKWGWKGDEMDMKGNIWRINMKEEKIRGVGPDVKSSWNSPTYLSWNGSRMWFLHLIHRLRAVKSECRRSETIVWKLRSPALLCCKNISKWWPWSSSPVKSKWTAMKSKSLTPMPTSKVGQLRHQYQVVLLLRDNAVEERAWNGIYHWPNVMRIDARQWP